VWRGWWRDEPVFEFICKAWPVGLLPAWSGFVIVGGGGHKVIKIGVWSDPVEGGMTRARSGTRGTYVA